jgi:hypothetical protein
MELKPEIDKEIQMELIHNGIEFPIDEKGRISIYEFRIDTKAHAGMLYILSERELPKGKLPFLAVAAKYVYGVFYVEGKVGIIEVSSMALNGKIKDWYVENRSNTAWDKD